MYRFRGDARITIHQEIGGGVGEAVMIYVTLITKFHCLKIHLILKKKKINENQHVRDFLILFH